MQTSFSALNWKKRLNFPLSWSLIIADISNHNISQLEGIIPGSLAPLEPKELLELSPEDIFEVFDVVA